MELERDSKIILPTMKGMMVFEHYTFGSENMLVIQPQKQYEKSAKSAIVRIQSGCIFSEVFKTIDCDCGLQLQMSLDILIHYYGFVFYLFQEGRGKGLQFKMKAIQLQQEQNIDTFSAYCNLGSRPDVRDYNIVSSYLEFKGIEIIELITNNPDRLNAMRKHGFLVSRSNHIIKPNKHNLSYLKDKEKYFNHMINFDKE